MLIQVGQHHRYKVGEATTTDGQKYILSDPGIYMMRCSPKAVL